VNVAAGSGVPITTFAMLRGALIPACDGTASATVMPAASSIAAPILVIRRLIIDLFRVGACPDTR